MTDSITGLITQLGLRNIDAAADEADSSARGHMVELAKERQLWDAATPEIAALMVAVYKKTMTAEEAKAEYREIRDRIKQDLLRPEAEGVSESRAADVS